MKQKHWPWAVAEAQHCGRFCFANHGGKTKMELMCLDISLLTRPSAAQLWGGFQCSVRQHQRPVSARAQLQEQQQEQRSVCFNQALVNRHQHRSQRGPVGLHGHLHPVDLKIQKANNWFWSNISTHLNGYNADLITKNEQFILNIFVFQN